jgi:hypothetical protein
MSPSQRDGAARAAKVVELHPASDHFSVGQKVFLKQAYYDDLNTSILEVPRYGWQVKEVAGDAVVIQYQRRNLKLLMTLMIETKYLKKEL